MNCDGILRQGVFEEIIIDVSKSVSENLIEWLSTAQQSFQNKKLKKFRTVLFQMSR